VTDYEGEVPIKRAAQGDNIMRTVLTVLAVAGTAMASSACATTSDLPTYREEMAQLTADCDARDGILVATGLNTGRAAADFACQLPAGTGRLN